MDANEAPAVNTVGGAIKAGSSRLLILGILLVFLGIISIGSPMITGAAIATMIGVLLLFAGVTRIIFAFTAHSWGRGIFAFVIGVLATLCGLSIIASPIAAMLSLTLLLAIYFIAQGISGIIFALQVKPLAGWGWSVFSGIIDLILGLMIWRQWPISGVWAIGVLVGIHLVMSGMALIGLSAVARNIVPK